jgi:uncharacterized YigZ family protein
LNSVFSYYTLSLKSESLFKEKGSKFFGYAHPADSEAEILSALDAVKTLHPKAKHICYAYRLGFEPIQEKVSDAGEPGGSAGLPILNQIKSAHLTNCILIVVRYFGGTKLGIPGLIHAYKTAAMEAITQNIIIEKEVVTTYVLTAPYDQANFIFQLMKPFDGVILSQQYQQNQVQFEIEIPKRNVNSFEAKITEQFQIRLSSK